MLILRVVLANDSARNSRDVYLCAIFMPSRGWPRCCEIEGDQLLEEIGMRSDVPWTLSLGIETKPQKCHPVVTNPTWAW